MGSGDSFSKYSMNIFFHLATHEHMMQQLKALKVKKNMVIDSVSISQTHAVKLKYLDTLS